MSVKRVKICHTKQIYNKQRMFRAIKFTHALNNLHKHVCGTRATYMSGCKVLPNLTKAQ